MRPSSPNHRNEVDFARHLEVKALSEAAKCRLRVLIWGPTPTAQGDQAKFAEKRRQIREALESDGHDAYFSEDLVTEGNPIPTNLLELFQLKEMDAVIILATDFGATGEAHEFGTLLGNKLLLWLPLAARGKFIEGVRRYVDAAGGRSSFFNDQQMACCGISLASVDFVNEKRYLQIAIDQQIEMLKEQAPIKTPRL
jgi:hypothetical protein